MSERKEDTILEMIKIGDSKTLEKLYDEIREPFLMWSLQQYQCDHEDVLEIYQNAFTIMYMNVKKGKLTALTSSIKTYIFSIGKNLFREKFRSKHNQTVNIEDVAEVGVLDQHLDTGILDQYADSEKKDKVARLLGEIGDPCKTLLKLIFIKGYSSEAVVHEMGYSDERVVRKRKSLCLKKMREMVAIKAN